MRDLLQRIVARDEIPAEVEDLVAEVRRRDILSQDLPEIRAWDGIIQLRYLFHSEGIPPAAIEGQHFDQRFIDFLAAQPDVIEQIHWRQLEYLCGEYFQRHGYVVEITPPRNDGGVDVVARRSDPLTGPELVIVQAKRLSGRGTVKINEVKALYTDLAEFGGTKACIATTTRLEAGAREFCEAHRFRMFAAEVDNVRHWIMGMRTPGVLKSVG